MASSLQNWGEIIRTQNLSSDKAMDRCEVVQGEQQQTKSRKI